MRLSLPAPQFVDLTFQQIAALPEDTVAILPLGAIEQQGAHRPVSTYYLGATSGA